MAIDFAHLLRIIALAVSFSLMVPRFQVGGSYGIFARLGLGFIITIAIFTGYDRPLTELDIVVAPLQGALTGVGLGLLVQLVFMGLEWAGCLIEQAIGFPGGSFDQLMSNRPIAHIYRLVGLGVLISLDGHRMVTNILLESLTGMGSVPTVSWSVSLIEKSCWFGLHIASPLLVTLLSLRIGISLISRVVPNMAGSSIAFPVQFLIGVTLIGLSLSMIIPSIERHLSLIQP